MKRTWAISSCLLGLAGAQFSAPGVGIGIQQAAPVVAQLARHVRVQPERLETMLAPGHTTGLLTFTLFSEVQTEVYIRPSDVRLVSRMGSVSPVVLTPYTEQSVSLVALAAHSGTLIFTNRAGDVIAQRPYVVAPAKAVSQSASLNYSPSSNRVGLSYSVSGVPQSLLDPSWSATINLGVNTRTQDVSGGVSVNVNW
jgi:hypothetical protein